MTDDPTDTTEPAPTAISPSAGDEITDRALQLERRTELPESEALVLAYAERGGRR